MIRIEKEEDSSIKTTADLLCKAASEGDLETIQRISETHVDFNDSSILNQNPFHCAAEKGHVACIRLLFQKGLTALDKRDWFGETPMHSAAQAGQASVIETFIQLGSTAIDTPNYRGWTPMTIAAHEGHNPVIEVLARLGSHAIDAPGDPKLTPMYWALDAKRHDTIQLLMALGAKIRNVPFDTQFGVQIHRVPFCVSSRTLTRIIKDLDDTYVFDVRHRVYFSNSLLSRLLFELERTIALQRN